VIDRYDPNVVADRTVQVYSKALTEPRVPVTLHDEDFLVELGLQHLLFTAGATSRESSMGAREISDMIGAPELSVKLVLGKLASKGYVTAHLDRQLDAQVRYYLTEKGITAESLKAFTHFS